MTSTAVVCTLPSDAHTWNLIVVAELLRELGLEVTNLGSCLSTHELVEQTRELWPDLLVVSSINGHGEAEAANLIDALDRAGVLALSRVVIGGKLAVSRERELALVPQLRGAGYAGVYTGPDSWPAFVEDLPHLLAIPTRDEEVSGVTLAGAALVQV